MVMWIVRNLAIQQVVLVMLVVGVAPLSVVAAQTPQDLAYLYQLGLSHDASLEAARNEREARMEALPASRGNLLPTLGLSAEQAWERRWSDEQSLFEDSGRVRRDRDQSVYQLNMTQPLIRVDAWHGLDAARQEAVLADVNFREALQSFNLRFIEAYMETLRSQTRLQTVRAQLKAVKQQKQQAESLLEAGMVSRLDVIQARAEEARVQAAMVDASGELDAAYRNLESLTGQPLGRLAPLNRHFDPQRHENLNPEKLETTALENHPGIVGRRLEYKRAEALTRQAGAAHYPTLDLTATASHSESDWRSDEELLASSDVNSDTVRVSLQLNVPLYSGGRTSSAHREARARELQAQSQMRAMIEDVKRQIQVSQNRLVNLGRSLTAAMTSLEAQDEALEATRKTFESGLKDMVDVVEAQRAVFGARQQVEDIRFDYMLALASLFQAVGRLDDGFIERINIWLGDQP